MEPGGAGRGAGDVGTGEERERERDGTGGTTRRERVPTPVCRLRDIMEAGEWDTGVWGPCGLAGTHV